jgi:hypothetical protein
MGVQPGWSTLGYTLLNIYYIQGRLPGTTWLLTKRCQCNEWAGGQNKKNKLNIPKQTHSHWTELNKHSVVSHAVMSNTL